MITIGIFGKINSGKSTFFNSLAGEQLSIVSNVQGTTSDNVIKMVELAGIGKVRLVDTAGFDDKGELSEARLSAVQKAFDMCDLVLLVVTEVDEQDFALLERCKKSGKKCLLVKNEFECEKAEFFNEEVVLNASNKGQVKQFALTIKAMFANEKTNILQGLVKNGDIVLLVMPQDEGAPEGRLILPQSMVIRNLLDIGAIGIATTPENFEIAFEKFSNSAKLVITDSSVFNKVYLVTGDKINITSFSALFAKVNGDITAFVNGANALDELADGDKILIMEACSHTASHKDIGAVVIPNAIKKYSGKSLQFEFLHGKDEPQNYADYKLIVHCGGCVQSRAFMISRVQKAKQANVQITNYGILLAKINGILNKIVY